MNIQFLRTLILTTMIAANGAFAAEPSWSCSSMCGEYDSFKYVYGTGKTAREAFKQMETACTPPQFIFVNWQPTSSCRTGAYTFASLQNACVLDTAAAETKIN